MSQQQDASDVLRRLAQFWDARYGDADSAYAYGTEPNTFLLQHAGPLPPGAQALCLADGEGRNGVWLARQGAVVHALDVSAAGLAKARQLAARHGVVLQTECADVTSAELGQDRWDLIVSIFLHLPAAARRALHRRCAAALKPGGRLLYEAYGPGQLALGTGGPRELSLLATLADVEADFEGLLQGPQPAAPPGMPKAPQTDAAAVHSGPQLKVLHRFQGPREVHEGALHHGWGEVVQWVVQRS